MQLRLEGSTVFALDYDGLALARDSLFNCLQGRQFAGQTLKEATADIRPPGTSVIKGQAFFKDGLLAAKTAGECLLIADYSYEKTVNQEEVIGRTDVFAGGNDIGSNAQITVGTSACRQGLPFEKRVVVPIDGQTIEVTLDKSQIMCFLVCF